MIPTKLDDETRSLAPPDDWNEELNGPCETLSVFEAPTDDGGNLMISAWMPTDAEIEGLQAGKPVYLGIRGVAHPVVTLFVPL